MYIYIYICVCTAYMIVPVGSVERFYQISIGQTAPQPERSSFSPKLGLRGRLRLLGIHHQQGRGREGIGLGRCSGSHERPTFLGKKCEMRWEIRFWELGLTDLNSQDWHISVFFSMGFDVWMEASGWKCPVKIWVHHGSSWIIMVDYRFIMIKTSS